MATFLVKQQKNMSELFRILQEPAFIAVYTAVIGIIIVSILTAKEKNDEDYRE